MLLDGLQNRHLACKKYCFNNPQRRLLGYLAQLRAAPKKTGLVKVVVVIYVVMHSLLNRLKRHCTSQQWFWRVRTQFECVITVSNTALTVAQLHSTRRSVAVQYRQTSGRTATAICPKTTHTSAIVNHALVSV